LCKDRHHIQADRLPVKDDGTLASGRHQYERLRQPASALPERQDSVNMDLTGALDPVSAWSGLKERNMTVDSQGMVYFTGSLGSVSAGIVALGPLLGDIDRNGRVGLADAVLVAQPLAGLSSQPSSSADINNDGKIGLAEMIFILQRVAGLR
jgi:hypothetical protein